jgi:uncharacterized protein (UPF0179 family)
MNTEKFKNETVNKVEKRISKNEKVEITEKDVYYYIAQNSEFLVKSGSKLTISTAVDCLIKLEDGAKYKITGVKKNVNIINIDSENKTLNAESEKNTLNIDEEKIKEEEEDYSENQVGFLLHTEEKEALEKLKVTTEKVVTEEKIKTSNPEEVGNINNDGDEDGEEIENQNPNVDTEPDVKQLNLKEELENEIIFLKEQYDTPDNNETDQANQIIFDQITLIEKELSELETSEKNSSKKLKTSFEIASEKEYKTVDETKNDVEGPKDEPDDSELNKERILDNPDENTGHTEENTESGETIVTEPILEDEIESISIKEFTEEENIEGVSVFQLKTFTKWKMLTQKNKNNSFISKHEKKLTKNNKKIEALSQKKESLIESYNKKKSEFEKVLDNPTGFKNVLKKNMSLSEIKFERDIDDINTERKKLNSFKSDTEFKLLSLKEDTEKLINIYDKKVDLAIDNYKEKRGYEELVSEKEKAESFIISNKKLTERLESSQNDIILLLENKGLLSKYDRSNLKAKSKQLKKQLREVLSRRGGLVEKLGEKESKIESLDKGISEIDALKKSLVQNSGNQVVNSGNQVVNSGNIDFIPEGSFDDTKFNYEKETVNDEVGDSDDTSDINEIPEVPGLADDNEKVGEIMKLKEYKELLKKVNIPNLYKKIYSTKDALFIKKFKEEKEKITNKIGKDYKSNISESQAEIFNQLTITNTYASLLKSQNSAETKNTLIKMTRILKELT